MAYHDSGEWNADTARQVRRARKFVGHWLKAHKRVRPRRPAIVLDIDDTSLSLYDCAKARNFENSVLCAVETDLPAIRQVHSFYDWARRHNVAVFFITGRPEGLRDITVTALRNAGYTGFLNLFLKPPSYTDPSVVGYKSGARKAIERKGYRILANLGDQRSDLKGGYSLRRYKLPEPDVLHALGSRAVQRLVHELVGALVLLAPHRAHGPAVELA